METYTITQQMIDEKPAYALPGITEPGEYTYSEDKNLYEPVLPKTLEGIVEWTQQYNRKVEFGIGSLGRHVEMPATPSLAAMERIEKMEARACYCRRCGQSDVFDGAMFTTGGGSICDDCFG